MLSIQLDQECEQYLIKILAQENIDSSELIKQLLKQHLETIQPRQSFVERRGGHPIHLLENAPANLSSREVRKPLVYEAVRAKYERRQQDPIPSTTVANTQEINSETVLGDV